MDTKREDEIRAEGLKEGFLLALDRLEQDFDQLAEVTPAPETEALRTGAKLLIKERRRMIVESLGATLQ